MKTKIILTLTLLTAVTIGLVNSLADNKKIDTKNIQVDIKTLYLDDPNQKICLPALLAEAQKTTSSILEEGSQQVYKHDPACQAGVFLPDKDNVTRCTFCGRVE